MDLVIRSRSALNTVGFCYILYHLVEKISKNILRVLCFLDFLNFHSMERNCLWEKIYVHIRWEMKDQKPGVLQVHRVTKNQTRLSDWTTTAD